MRKKMCGIFCLLTKTLSQSELMLKFKLFEENLSKRGPNSFKTQLITTENYNLLFAASVLWLRGETLTTQPLNDDKSFIFLYNGEIFGGSICDFSSSIGDTKLVCDIICSSNNIVESLEGLDGPYTFIFLNRIENKLYFGRDIYGRRSLLLGKSDNNEFGITSVAQKNSGYDFIELPSIGIFSVCLKTGDFEIYPWSIKNKNFEAKLNELETFLGKKLIKNSRKFNENKNFVEPTDDELKLFKEIGAKLNIFEILLNDSFWMEKVTKLQELLENSVYKRISAQPSFCSDCYMNYNCKHSLIGILFSGGIDCAILALIACKFTSDNSRPIDLINVAFDRSKNYETPDRITGLETLNELKQIKPECNWNFLAVNVKSEELNSARTETISHLIYPLNTILDDSLGCALWFASRGQTETYKSPTRVLLAGMGADELFGGYTRHRAALQKGGWQGLHQVLDEDWQNLSHRNLARDDRVVSDHGKQLRTPYLDENVVKFVRNLNSWEKTFPSKELPQGIGEKILLRSLGYHLGLRNAATFKKRALQFGSRIANPKENAHERSSRL